MRLRPISTTRRAALAGLAGPALLAATTGMPVAMAAAPAQTAAAPDKNLQQAVEPFQSLGGHPGFLLRCSEPVTGGGMRSLWEQGHEADTVMFVGSATKTFILAQCLRAIEVGTFKPTDSWAVDDAVRSPGSPVLQDLTGHWPAKMAMEAMISHSDNTSTDLCLAHVGPDAVRALIAQAGLRATRIPDSTRRMFSWIGGAAAGVDVGWAGIERMQTGWKPGSARPAMNSQETMQSTARELVTWYEDVLQGHYFTRPESLTEFCRISAMADALSMVVPLGLAAWGKGGSIDWEGFHCFCLPGQVALPNGRRLTFSFTLNWTGPDDGVPAVFTQFVAATATALQGAIARATT